MGCLLQFLLFIFILVFIGAVRLWLAVHTIMRNARQQMNGSHQQQSTSQQTTGQQYQQDGGQYQQNGFSSENTNTNPNKPRRRVFADNEGEYVDFQEV